MQTSGVALTSLRLELTESVWLNSNNQDLVCAVIAMAHDLGMETVAEGVETVEQLNQLKRFGCNYGQGFLLSRPISRTRVEQLLAQTHLAPAISRQQVESFCFAGS